jgi:DNA modification methylase
MGAMEAESVNAIITDLPYGTTACDWDEIIPFEPMWDQVKRILKPHGVFITTASQPFTSKLVMSNFKWFRYEWIWEKSRRTGFLNSKKMPLKAHENILVFYREQPVYHPQSNKGSLHARGGGNHSRAGVYKQVPDGPKTRSNDYYPVSVLYFPSVQDTVHATQKPVALYEYLIRTYTNPGDIVLDISAGSGTTGIAAHRSGRVAILIEKDPHNYLVMCKRVAEAEAQPTLFEEEEGA